MSRRAHSPFAPRIDVREHAHKLARMLARVCTRRSTVFTVLIALILAAPTACAQYPDSWKAWNVPVKPFRIIDNIYYVGATSVSSFLITSAQGHILLDGGMPATAPEILANIKALGFNPRDVRILINSHAHADHAGGLAELKRATGAKFVASVPDSSLLANGGHNDFAFGDKYLFPSIVADRTIRDGESIHVGTSTLVAHITPGHTRGCTTWTTTANDGGAQRAVVFTCSYSAPDYQLVNNPAYPNIIDDYRATFAKLRTLPCDVLLAPHGWDFQLDDKRKRVGTTPNPWVDAAACKAYIDTSAQAIEAKIREQQSAAKKP